MKQPPGVEMTSAWDAQGAPIEQHCSLPFKSRNICQAQNVAQIQAQRSKSLGKTGVEGGVLVSQDLGIGGGMASKQCVVHL